MSRLGPLIAKSAVSETYHWGDRQTLKLYRPGAPPDAAAREAAHARLAHEAGIPTPAVIEEITHDGRAGIVFERVDGPSMLEMLGQRPETVEALARQFALLHADLHGRAGTGLPGQRERLRRRIANNYAITAGVRAAALASLDPLPDGETLCHGDFHPGNIILARHGPIILDWFDATAGMPAADLCRTLLLLRFSVLPRALPAAVRGGIDGVRASFAATYLQQYTAHRPVPSAEVDAWGLSVAVARLTELVSMPEHTAIAAFIQGLLSHP